MTNEIRPKQSINIDEIENITSVSEGSVSKPTWNAGHGYAREKAINEARAKALEDYQLQQQEINSVFDTVRFQKLEGAVADLQARLSQLEGK